jgi:hypothetical protein
LAYNFIYFKDFIKLINLFDNLIRCKNYNKINKYIQEMEQIITKLNGFQKYVLK